MPRPPVTRPDDLTDALVRVVVREGLDRVSIRTVAAEAGVSIGTVQYHFATKDDLLLAAYRRVINQVTERALAAAAGARSQAEFVRTLLLQLLPLDGVREAELRVGIAFSARSVHAPPLAELYAEANGALVDALTRALRDAVTRGETPEDEDPERAARQLAALADGLAWHLACAPGALSAADAVAALDARLAELFPRDGPPAGP